MYDNTVSFHRHIFQCPNVLFVHYTYDSELKPINNVIDEEHQAQWFALNKTSFMVVNFIR